MITYVAKLINVFVGTIQSVLHIAWLVGKVIVDVLIGISSLFVNIIRTALLFFQIVYEDNISIFTEDLPGFLSEVEDAVAGQWKQVQQGVITIWTNITLNITTTLGTVKWFIDSFVIIVFEVLLLFKNTLILIGNTLWFILTFIPIQLPQILRVFFRSLTDVVTNKVVDAYMGLLKITNFLTDVPLESFIGIISAIVVVRLCVHFNEEIKSQAQLLYWFMVRKAWYYYYVFYNYFVDPDVREITRMSAGQEISEHDDEEPQSSGVIDDPNGPDSLCVICQEQQKCVLTLPCRHVCLCADCCRRLYGYQRTCPICRTFIYHAVTVYL